MPGNECPLLRLLSPSHGAINMPMLPQRIRERFQGIDVFCNSWNETIRVYLLTRHQMWLEPEEQAQLLDYLGNRYSRDGVLRVLTGNTLMGRMGRLMCSYRPTDDDPEVWAIPCSGCGEDMTSICSNCRQGTRCCCNCYECNSCSDRSSDSTCGDCDRCSSCCSCSSDDDDEQRRVTFCHTR